jgi:hypothetical protein
MKNADRIKPVGVFFALNVAVDRNIQGNYMAFKPVAGPRCRGLWCSCHHRHT